MLCRAVLGFTLLCGGCGVAEQPEWAKTVAAYEVPVPTAADKALLVEVLRKEAQAHGFHLDSATADELAAQSSVSPITFNATVWRGENDEEAIVSAMDFQDHLGRVWISFSLGQDRHRSTRFRNALVPELKRQWPETRSLPIMPSGAIPLVEDLVRTPSGYSVTPSAAAKYEEKNR
jgi:hypothetical protein